MRLRDWNKNLKIRLGAEALVNITFWMFFPFLAIYFTDSFGKNMAGFLLIFSQVFSVIANLMGGYCADRFGRKRMMVISAVGQGVFFVFFAFANSPWYESPIIGFICFTIVSIFGSFYWPASQAMVADVVEEKDRNDVFAIFYTSINIAVVIGPILGGIFYANYRFELLLISGLLCIALGLVLSKWINETAPRQERSSMAGSSNWLHFLKNQISEYAIIVRDKTFLLFIVAGVLVAQTFMQLDLLIPVYTKEAIGTQTLLSFNNWSYDVKGEQAFGLLISENGLLVALFTIVISRWMSSFKERNVFITSSLVYGISIFVMGQTNWIWGLIMAMALFTLAELMTAGIQNGFISKLAPEHMRGQYFAAASLRYTIGRMIAPLSIPMTDILGFTWTFGTLAILSFVSAFIFHIMYKRFETQKVARAVS
ncbi:MDR family MFS transporter [Peribacillus deserti]|uniref:MFS transporter n=1 Tax=Peribacillus deserti TaxID=673318 RepID=A0A2N5M0P9_9BACI|nr:MFS transporter [Peribacillus deserti]PLT27937.1 MFS transporter [Peribacillus deserti]